MLGYEHAIRAYSEAKFGQGRGPIYLDDVQCVGTETELSDCSRSKWTDHDCQHSEDAGVSCTSEYVSALPW